MPPSLLPRQCKPSLTTIIGNTASSLNHRPAQTRARQASLKKLRHLAGCLDVSPASVLGRLTGVEPDGEAVVMELLVRELPLPEGLLELVQALMPRASRRSLALHGVLSLL